MIAIARVTLVVLAGLLIAGSAAANSDIERPAVSASEHCQTIFTRYKQEVRPLFFVVSEDGNLCLFNYCRGGCRRGNQRNRAVLRCEQMSGQTCFVYAAYGQVIAPDLLELK